MNPYTILNVPPEADDATIHAAFLAAARRSPPEDNPAAFALAAEAYETLKTHSRRMEYLVQNLPGTLLSKGPASYAFLNHAFSPHFKPPEAAVLTNYLNQCFHP
jgi:curved DNA-binding protein CbpA